MAYNLRKYFFSYYFLVNVLRNEITFEKASPVIKVCLATDNADTSKAVSKPKRTGRNRSAAKLEDEELVKRIRRGQDFERSERQRKELEEMNKGVCKSFRRLEGRGNKYFCSHFNCVGGRGGGWGKSGPLFGPYQDVNADKCSLKPLHCFDISCYYYTQTK